MRWAVVGLLLLTSCASARNLCLPMRVYTAGEQSSLAAALAPLAPESPIVSALSDYEALRSANRACEAK